MKQKKTQGVERQISSPSSNQPFICGFHSYSPQQMNDLKESLKLKMPLPTLHLCSDYYRRREANRDPSATELRFLDDVAASLSSGSATTVSQLLIADPFVAVTYADMMNKRRELHPEATAPITPAEALGMASAYLNRSGKTPELKGHRFRFCGSDGSNDGAVGCEGSQTFLCEQNDRDYDLADGDVVVLLHRGELSHHRYFDAVRTTLNAIASQTQIKLNREVSFDGLFPMLLSVSTGICFDLRRLAIEHFSVASNLLFGHFAGYRMVALDKAGAGVLVEEARKNGLDPKVFVAIMNGNRTYVTFSGGESVSFETAFLRRLALPFSQKVTLPVETDTLSNPISIKPIHQATCEYLSHPSHPQRIAQTNRATVSASFCKTERSFFRSSMQALLAALLGIVSAGDSYKDCRLAVSIKHSPATQSPNSIGELLSSILGIYRLQCELGIPTAIRELIADSETEHPEITAFGLSSRTLAPSHFVQNGSRVYCVTPMIAEDGLPAFPALRQLLRDLEAWNRDGIVKSARVICDQTVTDALTEHSASGLTCKLTDPAVAVGEKLPLAILLEADRELPLAEIGKVEASVFRSEQAATYRLPKLSETLNAGERYGVTILASKGDTSAAILAEILCQRGADCRLFTEKDSVTAQAREILLSQITMLGRNYRIEENLQLQFALETQQKAGGCVIALGNNGDLSEKLCVLTLENGIEEDLLMRIFD
ncbi:MAG: hypothetical protein E7620_07770 [Ruminococcaceae bacterium]|nr:hypothetical protein [Oscillospiraceae bacterium]